MKIPPLPPYEEFIKMENDSKIAEDNKAYKNIQEAMAREVSKMCLGYLERYHNWLMEQLEGNVESAETETDME